MAEIKVRFSGNLPLAKTGHLFEVDFEADFEKCNELIMT
jgi:hypothetical protein